MKKGRYFIKTDQIDQLYDGFFFYTIVHENKEIIKSSDESNFLNLIPNQILKRLSKDFSIEIDEIDTFSYYLKCKKYN